MNTPPRTPRELYKAETHTPEQIMAEKNRVDGALQNAKHDMADARRKARTSGTFMPADEFARLEKRIAALGRKSQNLQLEMHRAKARRRAEQPKTIESFFMDVCREELAGLDMKEMLEEATRRAQQHASQPNKEAI